ncbi:NAD(P)/FAD-dependent oxidoreductase [Seohaeicola zhoushanensis]
MLPGFSEHAYWLEGLPQPPELPSQPLPQVDVAIVGSGYTGLNAAIETARGGRSTLVLDAGDPGWGCSTRNGGQISTSVKPSLDKLSARYGAERARAIRQEGQNALDWIERRIAQEGIYCHFRRAGRFHAAHTPRHYEELVREADELRQREGIDSIVVPRSEQRSELGTDAYFGGVVYTRHASINPAQYHRGLLKTALEAGAHVTGNCAVTGVVRDASGFLLDTEKGRVRARDVIIATNGYTSRLTPWLRRRVIPIGSYIIATEELPVALVDELFPTDRIASDTCKVVYYYRASPDRRRILFGGRVSASETDPAASGPKLYDDMCRVFPELRSYGVSHSWTRYRRLYLRRDGAHRGSQRHPLCNGLLRLGRLDGVLSRNAPGAEGAGPVRGAHGLRRSAVSDATPLQRPPLVSAGHRGLVPVARSEPTPARPRGGPSDHPDGPGAKPSGMK